MLSRQHRGGENQNPQDEYSSDQRGRGAGRGIPVNEERGTILRHRSSRRFGTFTFTTDRRFKGSNSR